MLGRVDFCCVGGRQGGKGMRKERGGVRKETKTATK